MLQWGFPQFYNQQFMPLTTVLPPVQNWANPFGSIFNYSNPGMPVYTQVPYNYYNFLVPQGATTPTITTPKPQGVRSKIGELWDNTVDTTKRVYHKVKKTVSNFANNMVSTAKKYLGYNEKNGSYKKFTQGRTEKWCADFVSYVARECGIKGFNFAAVQQIWDWGKANGKFHKTAKIGDVVIFKGVDKNGKKVSHTGIVTAVENGQIKTIEGNTSHKVAERSYSLNDTRITGYVTIA